MPILFSQISGTAFLRALSQRRLNQTLLASSTILAGFATAAHAGNAPLPVGGSVAQGVASVSATTNSTTVNQSSARAVINWQSFDVAAGKSVVFNQPDAQSATLNRVTGATTSTIAGQITSNGAVYLVNPNGIAITSTGTVNTAGGFVASTLDIADADFMAGTLAFKGNGASNAVTNAGHVNTIQGAYVALLGGAVSNSGTINVPYGKVGLGSGESIALDLNGNGFMQVAVPSALLTGSNALIDNSGSIATSGGTVQLQAAVVKDAIRNVINMSGSINADSATGDGGTIHLIGGADTANMAGTVTVNGSLSAQATGASGNGGFVETSGASVDLNGVRVSTLAANGTAGTWLIDPTDFTVAASGGDISGAQLSTNLGAGNVTIISSQGASGTNGDVNINDPISWSSGNTLSFVSYRNININANISATGANSGLILRTDDSGIGIGSVLISNGITIELTGASSISKIYYDPATFGTVSTFNQITSANKVIYSLVNNINDLQNVNNFLGENFALGRTIDASVTSSWNSGAGFIPLGTDGFTNALNNAHGFTGQFDGLGHAILNIAINRPGARWVGLFGVIEGATIQNANMIGGHITVGTQYLGIAGGLIGEMANSTISNSSSSVAVTGNEAGGLVGDMVSGTIVDCYAIGAATAVGSASTAGGLVGSIGAGTITTSYASGAVSGQYVGGIAGLQTGGTVSNSYWDSYSSGLSVATGFKLYGTATNVNAVTSDPAQSAAPNYAYIASAYPNLPAASGLGTVSPTGWIFLPGMSTRPFLANEEPAAALSGTDTAGRTLIWDSHQLQLLNASSLTDNYALAMTIDLSDTALATGGAPRSYAGMWTTTGFIPIGSDGNSTILNNNNGYTGQFVGAGNTVTNIYINRPSSADVGLFAQIGTSGSVTTLGVDGGTIVGGSSYVGALVGYLAGGASRDYANVSVSSASSGSVGGLIGILLGTLRSSYATGTVSGAVGARVGGLVGATNNLSTITNSYASGAVSVIAGTNSAAGGLVGLSGGTVSSSYWDSYSTGQSNAAGLRTTGTVTAFSITSDPSQASANNYAFKPTAYRNLAQTNWVIIPNLTRPFGAWEVPSVNAAAEYNVNSTHSLQLIGDNVTYLNNTAAGAPLSGSYMLGGSLGLAQTGAVSACVSTSTCVPGSYSGMWTSSGFTPIGTDGAGNILNGGAGFSGSFNGGGFTLSGLNINTSSKYAGLFGYSTGAISNLTVAGTVTSTGNFAGGVVGFQIGGSISNVISYVNVSGFAAVGGIAGSARGINLTNSSASGTISGANEIGGIAGEQVGGTWTGVTSTASVTGTGAFTGGLVGVMYGGSLSGSASGTVSGALDAGGAVGYQQGSGSVITGASSSGATVTGTTNVGGLVGYAEGSISNSTSSDTVTGISFVGGFAGRQAGGSISNSSASGSVTGGSATGGQFVGGLIGYQDAAASITGSSASGSVGSVVSSGPVNFVGGLVGDALGSITNSSASGAVGSGVSTYVGGLVGYQSGAAILTSKASGTVMGATSTGGLVGYAVSGSIDQSYASGAVSGTGSYAGGLIGLLGSGTVTNVYATGSTSGGALFVGGLIGYQMGGSVAQAYATGSITGGIKTGGLIGYQQAGSLTNGLWDTQTSGIVSGFGYQLAGATFTALGFTTLQLQDFANYTTTYPGFDFTTIWTTPNQAGQNGQTTAAYPTLTNRP
jgi:filamentous hemagglutinin family protein